MIVAFIAMSITELLWTLYIHSVRDEELKKAGLYNLGIFVATFITTILYMNNKWMVIPAAAGAYFGTVISKYFYTKK